MNWRQQLDDMGRMRVVCLTLTSVIELAWPFGFYRSLGMISMILVAGLFGLVGGGWLANKSSKQMGKGWCLAVTWLLLFVVGITFVAIVLVYLSAYPSLAMKSGFLNGIRDVVMVGRVGDVVIVLGTGIGLATCSGAVVFSCNCSSTTS